MRGTSTFRPSPSWSSPTCPSRGRVTSSTTCSTTHGRRCGVQTSSSSGPWPTGSPCPGRAASRACSGVPGTQSGSRSASRAARSCRLPSSTPACSSSSAGQARSSRRRTPRPTTGSLRPASVRAAGRCLASPDRATRLGRVDGARARRASVGDALRVAIVGSCREEAIALLVDGARRARTADLLRATQALSQLSYGPG